MQGAEGLSMCSKFGKKIVLGFILYVKCGPGRCVYTLTHNKCFFTNRNDVTYVGRRKEGRNLSQSPTSRHHHRVRAE